MSFVFILLILKVIFLFVLKQIRNVLFLQTRLLIFNIFFSLRFDGGFSVQIEFVDRDQLDLREPLALKEKKAREDPEVSLVLLDLLDLQEKE